MFHYLLNPKVVSLIHILLVVPVLVAEGTDNFPGEYKKWLLVLAAILAFYHLYNFYMAMQVEKAMLMHATQAKAEEHMIAKIDGHNVHYVKIFDSSPGYDKPVVQIKPNDVVVWMNIGEVEHTIMGNNQEFSSGEMKPGDSFSVKFDKVGTYNYYCVDHLGWQRGVVIVQ